MIAGCTCSVTPTEAGFGCFGIGSVGREAARERLGSLDDFAGYYPVLLLFYESRSGIIPSIPQMLVAPSPAVRLCIAVAPRQGAVLCASGLMGETILQSHAPFQTSTTLSSCADPDSFAGTVRAPFSPSLARYHSLRDFLQDCAHAQLACPFSDVRPFN